MHSRTSERPSAQALLANIEYNKCDPSKVREIQTLIIKLFGQLDKYLDSCIDQIEEISIKKCIADINSNGQGDQSETAKNKEMEETPSEEDPDI